MTDQGSGVADVLSSPAVSCLAELDDESCRLCGCTELDCSGCIAIIGDACHWLEDNLCSACAMSETDLKRALSALTWRHKKNGIALGHRPEGELHFRLCVYLPDDTTATAGSLVEAEKIIADHERTKDWRASEAFEASRKTRWTFAPNF